MTNNQASTEKTDAPFVTPGRFTAVYLGVIIGSFFAQMTIFNLSIVAIAGWGMLICGGAALMAAVYVEKFRGVMLVTALSFTLVGIGAVWLDSERHVDPPVHQAELDKH